MPPTALAASTLETAAPPLVGLRGVSKRYANGTLAVQGLDLEIGAGSFVSLLGPSGCGKSTVLRWLAGVLPAELAASGRLTLDGSPALPPHPAIGGALVPATSGGGALFVESVNAVEKW